MKSWPWYRSLSLDYVLATSLNPHKAGAKPAVLQNSKPIRNSSLNPFRIGRRVGDGHFRGCEVVMSMLYCCLRGNKEHRMAHELNEARDNSTKLAPQHVTERPTSFAFEILCIASQQLHPFIREPL
jgi:hypothetical protein